MVSLILNDETLYEEWKAQIVVMAERIKKMRGELRERLEKLGTPGKWEHITNQIGKSREAAWVCDSR